MVGVSRQTIYKCIDKALAAGVAMGLKDRFHHPHAPQISEAAKRLERVLWNDPASGVWRHADAGYDIALRCAKDHGLRLPGILGN